MNALENVYNIGYLDGRNHVLALIVLWSKKKKPETVLHTLSNKETLEETLEAFDRSHSRTTSAISEGTLS